MLTAVGAGSATISATAYGSTANVTISVLAVQRTDGAPLALLANYSQHYYGSDLVSSDYYGRFARHVASIQPAVPRLVLRTP